MQNSSSPIGRLLPPGARYRAVLSRAKIVLAAIVVLLAAGLIVGTLVPEEEAEPGRGEIFHVRLAEPSMYSDGVYTDSFEAPGGQYVFDFVPNGSSPEILSITLRGGGDGPEYREDFVLEGTKHEALLGEYYTWEYLGQTHVAIQDGGTVSITIDPHGDTLGSVSVYLFHLIVLDADTRT